MAAKRPCWRIWSSGLRASGIAARAAIADSWGAAHALARYVARPTIVVPPARTPTAICRCRSQHCGCRPTWSTICAGSASSAFRISLAKPRAPLALRFGPELGRRLDQAMGRLSEPIDPIRPPEIVEVRRAFAEPIGAAETIARYTGKLVAQLCDALEAKGLGARRLDLLFHRVDNRLEAIRVGTALPVRDAKRLTRLLCDKIETIDPGFGIEIMSLAATLAEPLVAEADDLLAGRRQPEADVSDLIDMLANRVGEQRLYRFAPVASDVPERSVRRVAPTAPDTGEGWPEPLAAAGASVADAGADRDRRAAARSSARHLHLARHTPARETRRRPRARLRRMVEARRRTDRGAGLFPGRGRSRRALSGFIAPATARIQRPARTAGSCTGSSDERRRATSNCR